MADICQPGSHDSPRSPAKGEKERRDCPLISYVGGGRSSRLQIEMTITMKIIKLILKIILRKQSKFIARAQENKRGK